MFPQNDPFDVPHAIPSAAQPHNDRGPQEQRSLIKSSSSARYLASQIATYVAVQMDAHYRTHAFFVLVVKDYARCVGITVEPFSPNVSITTNNLNSWSSSSLITQRPLKYGVQ
jgi:hypothetical protein